MTINYDYYRIFYAVAQCRSFTRAAEVLKNNQPNITRCMKNLEQELGCKLFHRSNRGITLTPEGQRLYRRVAAAVEEIQLGEEEIRQDGSLESGTLSISASEAALHMVLLDKLSAFRIQYPGVHLRITNETTPQSIERLRNGESDFAVITAPQLTDRASSRPSCCGSGRCRSAAPPTAKWPPGGAPWPTWPATPWCASARTPVHTPFTRAFSPPTG